MDMAYGWIDSDAAGRVVVVMGTHGVVTIGMDVEDVAAFIDDVAPGIVMDEKRIASVLQALEEYFAGERSTFDVSVDLKNITPFRREVLAATAQIPYSEVRSYGDIARAIGRPNASRAVGQALGANPIPIIIPCHRVIGSNGKLTGFSSPGGLDTKSRLLLLESKSKA